MFCKHIDHYVNSFSLPAFQISHVINGRNITALIVFDWEIFKIQSHSITSQQNMTSVRTGKKKAKSALPTGYARQKAESDWTWKRRVRRLLLHWGVNWSHPECCNETIIQDWKGGETQGNGGKWRSFCWCVILTKQTVREITNLIHYITVQVRMGRKPKLNCAPDVCCVNSVGCRVDLSCFQARVW